MTALIQHKMGQTIITVWRIHYNMLPLQQTGTIRLQGNRYARSTEAKGKTFLCVPPLLNGVLVNFDELHT
jgi:hypothetical protein